MNGWREGGRKGESSLFLQDWACWYAQGFLNVQGTAHGALTYLFPIHAHMERYPLEDGWMEYGLQYRLQLSDCKWLIIMLHLSAKLLTDMYKGRRALTPAADVIEGPSARHFCYRSLGMVNGTMAVEGVVSRRSFRPFGSRLSRPPTSH